MFDSMRGARLKLGWANKHYDALKALVSGHVNTVVIERDEGLDPTDKPDVFFLNWRVVELSNIPPDWTLMVGDLLHNLRSVMDYITWQLGWWDVGVQPFGKTAFPICDTASLFKQKHWVLQSLSDEHRTLIESCQPYMRGNGEWPYRPLSDLRELSDQDKHRTVPVALAAAGPRAYAEITYFTGADRVQAHFLAGYPLNLGAPVVKVKVWRPAPDFDVEVKYTMAPYVGLRREVPGTGGSVLYVQDLAPTLRSMIDAVDFTLKRCEPAMQGLPLGIA